MKKRGWVTLNKCPIINLFPQMLVLDSHWRKNRGILLIFTARHHHISSPYVFLSGYYTKYVTVLDLLVVERYVSVILSVNIFIIEDTSSNSSSFS